jgi:hypothetical protein
LGETYIVEQCRSALTEQVIIYQRSKLQKIDRRLAKFDFRYNNRSGLGVEDTERVAKIAKNVGSIAARRPAAVDKAEVPRGSFCRVKAKWLNED